MNFAASFECHAEFRLSNTTEQVYDYLYYWVNWIQEKSSFFKRVKRISLMLGIEKILEIALLKVWGHFHQSFSSTVYSSVQRSVFWVIPSQHSGFIRLTIQISKTSSQ